MLIREFDYHLPPERIAQHPAEPRDSARLLHLQASAPAAQQISHHHISDLPTLLRSDDLLITNDTRVLRARLHGHKNTGAKIEALLLREVERNLWEVLLRPSARLKVGSEIIFEAAGTQVHASPAERLDNTWLLRFKSTFADNSTFDIRHLLDKLGEVPLPPYIHASPDDPERYQTVYSREHPESAAALDSAAAPTAGLHFTPQLMDTLRQRGVRFASVTLGIGLGTFLPVKSDTLEGHHMHREEFDIPESTARAIRAQKQAGKRVIAVGTTVSRALEAASQNAASNDILQSGPGSTDIFIYPPYRFRCVDALLTNFHLPKSTLLAMVSALADNLKDPASPISGIEIMQRTYKIAVEQEYRFFSFGDAMLIE